MELCCSVNGDRKCTRCRRAFCPQHSYQLPDVSVFASIHEYMCHGCYEVNVRKPFIETPRAGMTFSELYLAVRKITPTGFVSIKVELADHRPGGSKPEMAWSIYHEKLRHSEGKTPEQALASFVTAVQNWTDKSSPADNVNI
jgi:hypothetical protein